MFKKDRICGFPDVVSPVPQSPVCQAGAETDSFLAQFGTTLIASA